MISLRGLISHKSFFGVYLNLFHFAFQTSKYSEQNHSWEVLQEVQGQSSSWVFVLVKEVPVVQQSYVRSHPDIPKYKKLNSIGIRVQNVHIFYCASIFDIFLIFSYLKQIIYHVLISSIWSIYIVFRTISQASQAVGSGLITLLITLAGS